MTPDAVSSCVIFFRVRQSNKHQAETRDVHTTPTKKGEGVLEHTLLEHTPRKPAPATPALLTNITNIIPRNVGGDRGGKGGWQEG